MDRRSRRRGSSKRDDQSLLSVEERGWMGLCVASLRGSTVGTGRGGGEAAAAAEERAIHGGWERSLGGLQLEEQTGSVLTHGSRGWGGRMGGTERGAL